MSDRLDRALDDALRGLVAGDGPADMRQRVLARLAERHAAVPAPLLLAAAGVMAALATALLFGPQPHLSTRRAAAPAVTPTTAARPRAEASPESAIERTPAGRRAPPTLATRLAGTPQPSLLIAPLEPPPPLEIAALEGASVEVVPLAIQPLEIERLEIETLPDDAGR